MALFAFLLEIEAKIEISNDSAFGDKEDFR